MFYTPEVIVIAALVFMIAFTIGYIVCYKDERRLRKADAMFSLRLAVFVAKSNPCNYPELRKIGSRLMRLD